MARAARLATILVTVRAAGALCLVLWRGERSLGYSAALRHLELRAAAQALSLDGAALSFADAVARAPDEAGQVDDGAVLQWARGLSLRRCAS